MASLCGLGFLQAWYSWGGQICDLETRALRVNVVVNSPFIPSLGGHFHHILSVRAIIDLVTVKGREASSLMKRMSKHLKPCFPTATGPI